MPIYRVVRSTTKLESFIVEAASASNAIDACSGSGTLIGSSAIYDVQEQYAPPPPMNLPSGFGFYLRRISGGVDAAKELLQRCRESSVRWVSFMVEASDGYRVSLDTTKLYASVLAPELNLWVWTFPGEARASSVEQSVAAAELALEYKRQIGAKGVMLDIEAPYKNRSASLSALVSSTMQGLSGQESLGMVSYPTPSLHPTLDWNLFRHANWGSPMLYNTAATVEGIDKSIAEWSQIVPVIIPSMATYDTASPGTGAEQLNGDIERVMGGPPPRFSGAIMWSEQSTDAAERQVMSDWAKKYGS